MKVKEIMSKDIIYLSPEDNVSKLISLIEKYHLREILIIENGTLKGIVYSKGIAKKGIFNPTQTKISTIMQFPTPMVSPEEDVESAADLIFRTGLRALPVVENKKVLGVISTFDIIKLASKTKDFKQTLVESVMSIPEIINDNTDIGAARILMREKNISRLPVVDRNQKLCGIITIFDLLRAVKPRERVNFYSMAAEKETIMRIPVSTIMNISPLTTDGKKSLNEIVNLMIKYNTDGIIITEDSKLNGIITAKDLLEAYVSSFKQKGVFYQIIGLEDEDDFIIETVDRMVRDTLEKMSKMFRPQSFFLHVKRYDKEGKIKYSIRTRYRTDKKTFVSKSFAWDLREAVDTALDNLERIMLKERGETSDKIKEALRFKKLQR